MTVFADPQTRWWAHFLVRLFGSLLIGVLAVAGIMATAQAAAADPHRDTPAQHGEAGAPNPG